MKKLNQFEAGKKVKIIKIEAGRGATVNLTSLGLHSGNIVQIMRKSKLGGPIIVNFRDTEIAIGEGLAKKIIVEEAQ